MIIRFEGFFFFFKKIIGNTLDNRNVSMMSVIVGIRSIPRIVIIIRCDVFVDE